MPAWDYFITYIFKLAFWSPFPIEEYLAAQLRHREEGLVFASGDVNFPLEASPFLRNEWELGLGEDGESKGGEEDEGTGISM